MANLHVSTFQDVSQRLNDRTNGTIEVWHLILKRNDHKQQRKRPDVFLKEHHPILLGQQLSYCDNLTAKEKKNVMARE